MKPLLMIKPFKMRIHQKGESGVWRGTKPKRKLKKQGRREAEQSRKKGKPAR